MVTASDDADRAALMEAMVAAGLDPVDGGTPPISSDNVPFQTRGVPAIWVVMAGDRHYHTVKDTADSLDYDAAIRAVRAQWSVVAPRLGLAP